MTKRLISFLLALTFVITVAPIGIFATSVDTASIAVVDASAFPGDSVEVYVIIKDNPGVTGATLAISYDDALTLTDAVAGAAFSSLAFSKPGTYASPCNFVWDAEAASDESTENGVIMKLVFEVDGAVEAYTKMNVDVSYSFGDVYNNGGDVSLDIQNGYVIAVEYVPGDVNGDDRVTTKDTQLIRQLIAGGYESAWEAAGITVNASAADVNDDGRVNSKDTQLIRQVVAGGYTDEYGVPVRLIPVTPACKHSLTAFAAKDATCAEEGNIAYWYCESCNSYFSDAEGLNEISESETVTAKKNHALTHYAKKDATCTEEGNIEYWQCEECDKYFADENATGEIKESDIVIAAVGHSLTKITENAASCTEAGNITYWQCNVCETCFADEKASTEINVDETVITPNGHALHYVEAKEPTCSKTGNIEYWYCSACETAFSDSDGKNEIEEEDTILSVIDHGLNLIHVEAVDATVDAAGVYEHWYCTECGKFYSDANAENEISEADTVESIVPSYTITFFDERNWDDTNNAFVIKVPQAEMYNLSKFTPPEVTGYSFAGWFTIDGAPAKVIPAGNTDNKMFIADWNLEKYTITCKLYNDAPLNHCSVIEYTIEDEIIIPDPEWNGLNFAYWTVNSGNVDKETVGGRVVYKVPKGNYGNVELTATWRYRENLAVANYTGEYRVYYEPNTMTHSFVYQLGTIENVVVKTHALGDITGINALSWEQTWTTAFGESSSKEIGKTVSNSVTKTDEWQTSKEWVDSKSKTDEHKFSLKVSGEYFLEWEAGYEYTGIKTNTESYGYTCCEAGSDQVGIEESNSISSTVAYNNSYSHSLTEKVEIPVTSPHGTYRYVSVGTVYVYAVVTYDQINKEYFINTYSVLKEDVKNTVLYTPLAEDSVNANIIENDGLPYIIPSDFIEADVDNFYYVEFDSNNGNGSMAICAFSPTVKCQLPSNEFVRPGYVFSGWALSADGKIEYYDMAEVTDIAKSKETVKLYAKWLPIEYKVNWENGPNYGVTVNRIYSDVAGVGALSTGAAVYYGDKLEIIYTAVEGYTVNKTKETIVVGAADLGPEKFVANATAVSYIVTFDYNDGTGRQANQTHTFDAQNKALGAIFRDGYAFLGWSHSNNAKVASYSPEENVGNDCYGNRNLYAVWLKVNYSTGYYSRDTIFVDNDFEGDECITDWFNPGFDVDTLLANGYTRIKVNIAVHGERNNGWAPNNEPYIDIYNANESKITTVNLDEYGSSFSIQYREFYLDLTSLVGDGRVKFRYDTKRDSWELGTTEVTMTAVK